MKWTNLGRFSNVFSYNYAIWRHDFQSFVYFPLVMYYFVYLFSSVQFSHSVVSNSFGPHGLQHTRLPCPWPTPGVYSNSCLSSGWHHPTISSSVVPSPPAFDLSQHQGLFQWVSSSHKWPKYWSFSFRISPFHEYSGMISFRIDWLDLLAVPETHKNLLQHHSSKASILQLSVFFIVQLSHP